MPSTKSKKEKINKSKSDGAVEKIRAQLAEIERSLKDQQHRLAELEKKIKKFSGLESFSPQKLRGELIEGIRLLGEKVSVAVQEINRRHERFSKELNEKLQDLQNQLTEKKQNTEEQRTESAALELKESKLLDEGDFEIVPKDAIEKLIELSRKQAVAIKNTVSDLKSQMALLEEKMNSDSSDSLAQTSKRNNKAVVAAIVISMIALIVSIISLILIFR